MSDVWEEVRVHLHRMARGAAREVSTPIERFRVTQADPLIVVAERDDGLVLEDGDDDFTITRAVADATPSVGDVVLVHEEHDGDFVAIAVIG